MRTNARAVRLRRAALSSAAALGIALIVPAGADARNTIKVSGGTAAKVTICGKAHKARVVARGARVVAKLRVNGKRPRRGARVKIARCQNGRFVTVSKKRARSQRRVPTAQSGDLRITWRKRTSYVRVVGVPSGAQPMPGQVRRVPVSFRVQNVNHIAGAPCPGVDGNTYTVRGHITAPVSTFEAGGEKTATLFNHGHSFDEQLWTYGGVGGYDFTGELAKSGHTSVSYDRLGYDKSDKLDGNRSCYSSEGDIAHQMIDKLKSGDYSVDGGTPVRFGRVALAGESQSALVNEAVASTFKNQDALLHLGFAPAAFATPPILAKYAAQVAECSTNSKPADGKEGNPKGYGYRGATDQEFIDTNFHNADPKVIADFTARRKPDPCGLPLYVSAQIDYAAANDQEVRGPVLVVLGEKDPNFFPTQDALLAQRAVFSGTSDIQSVLMPDTGHMLPLERSAPRLQQIVSAWLKQHGF